MFRKLTTHKKLKNSKKGVILNSIKIPNSENIWR